MAHLGHGTSNSNKIFLFNYLINRMQKRVTKNNRKKKKNKTIAKDRYFRFPT